MSLDDHASVNRETGSPKVIIPQKRDFVNVFRKKLCQKFVLPTGVICGNCKFGRKKNALTVIFQFLCPNAGDCFATPTAHKGAQSPPLCEFLAKRSWDSALRPRTDSGLPAFRFLGRDKVQCKSVQIVRSLQTAVRNNKEYLKFRFHLSAKRILCSSV